MGNKSLQKRALFLVTGLVFLALGLSAVARKDLSYLGGLGELVFAPAVLLVGVLLVIMAFFKPESIERKWIQPRSGGVIDLQPHGGLHSPRFILKRQHRAIPRLSTRGQSRQPPSRE